MTHDTTILYASLLACMHVIGIRTTVMKSNPDKLPVKSARSLPATQLLHGGHPPVTYPRLMHFQHVSWHYEFTLECTISLYIGCKNHMEDSTSSRLYQYQIEPLWDICHASATYAI